MMIGCCDSKEESVVLKTYAVATSIANDTRDGGLALAVFRTTLSS